MIAIVNVTKGGIKPGLNDYEIRINREFICAFHHHRELGLGSCLAHAAMAAMDYENRRNDDLYNQLLHMLSEQK